MLFSNAVPLNELVRFCHLARHGLSAGLSLPDVFRQQADRGPPRLRPIVAAISERLERGDSLEDALKSEGHKLPPLFLTMSAVGEQSGHLPEAFAELGRYFELQSQLRRQFLIDIFWPALEFGGAIFVIATMLLILGLVGAPIDPFGIGTGWSGAGRWLLLVFGTLAILYGSYRLLKRLFRRKAGVERLLLRIPVIGSCLEAIALSRFCLAMRLTMGAGLPVKTAVRRSLEATDNAAYPARYQEAAAVLRRGDDLSTILRACDIFPSEFLNIVESAEESGRVPEVMEKQSQFYQEESSLRLKILTRFAAFGVWGIVAVLIIVAIVRLYLVAYIGPINQLLNEIEGKR